MIGVSCEKSLCLYIFWSQQHKHRSLGSAIVTVASRGSPTMRGMMRRCRTAGQTWRGEEQTSASVRLSAACRFLDEIRSRVGKTFWNFLQNTAPGSRGCSRDRVVMTGFLAHNLVQRVFRVACLQTCRCGIARPLLHSTWLPRSLSKPGQRRRLEQATYPIWKRHRNPGQKRQSS